ncbi:MAG TPA: thiosulfate oxidation carrier protein SoxY [Xanthobacteraceae bacterium]|jgi:sulfur-oxidizing protein SoxY|nr:thiosulfate oxidation carrier protein SoxY [Xanthobacteraceae bacterium]
MQRITRRQALAYGAAATAFLTVADYIPALATPAESDAEIAKFTGGKALEKGKITIDLPEIAENGNTVPLSVTVDSPMSAQSYVSDMLVVADGNPRPGVATFHFTPLSGSATAATRIRLSSTQNIIVVAKTSDGKFISDRKQVKVTIGGCGG